MTMLREEFLDFMKENYDERIKEIGDIEQIKVPPKEDVFTNFRAIAAMLEIPPETAVAHLMSEKYVELLRMLQYRHPKAGSLPYLYQIAHDIQNYIDVALAILTDRERNEDDLTF